MNMPHSHRHPRTIVDHRASGILSVGWQDGSESRIPHWLLRARCRCAECQQAFRLCGERPAAPSSIRLAEILPMSDRALNLVFSDGHGRGIYPWDYLREIARDPVMTGHSHS